MLFSTKAIIVKNAFHDTHIDAVSLLAIRMIFSLPFYLGVAFFAGHKKDNVRFTKLELYWILMLGLFGYYISSLLDFVGLQYVSAGLERLILFLYPSFAVLMNAAVFKQSFSRIQILALALTYTGIVIAYIGQLHFDTASTAFFLGSFLIFLCAITYAIYITGSGNLIGPVSTIIQAHFILGEKIFTEQIAGMRLVVAGVLLIGWKCNGLAVQKNSRFTDKVYG